LLTLGFALAMFASLADGSSPALVAGCLLFQAASVIDGVDGEVARATYRVSASGAALDTGVDMITNLLFIIGISIGLARHRGIVYAAVGGFATIGLLAGMLAMMFLVRKGGRGGSFDIIKTAYASSAPDRVRPLVLAVTVITSRDFFAFAFALVGLVGLSWIIPWIMAGAVILWLPVVAFAAVVLLGGQSVRSGSSPAANRRLVQPPDA
jgi:CDP-L-myo-inositol myo-inositolphosphotransferase